MTVRLLKPYAGRPANAITSVLDASTEAGLIAAGQASADLTGGVRYYAPKPSFNLQAPQIAVGAVSLKTEEQCVCALPEGQVLKIVGGAGAVGEATRTGTTDKWTIGAGTVTIGPYSGMQRIPITCTAGSIDATVGDAVVAVAQAQRATLTAGQMLPKTRAKIARIRAGDTSGTNGRNGRLKVAFVGDSTTAGAGAGASGTSKLYGARAKNITAAMAALLTQRGLPAKQDSFIGDQYIWSPIGQANYPLYDPRVAFTGTTAIYPNGSYKSLGGVYFQLKAAGDTISFTPSGAWDTAVIYLENGAAGTAGVSINGGASSAGLTGNTTVTTTNSGAASFATQVLTKALGAATIQIGNVTGNQNTGTPVIRGIWCYDSTSPGIDIFCLGEYGTQLSVEFAASSMAAALAADAYDLVFLDMSINDANILGAAGVDAFVAAMDGFVKAAAAVGTEVVLCTCNSVNVAAAQVYADAILAYGITNNTPVIDHFGRMSPYTTANANGLMADSLHPGSPGYWDKGSTVTNFMLSL